MENPAGESNDGALRLDFDRRLKLEFHGSRITSDVGLLAYRELDDALGLTDMVGDELVDPRTGKNGQHEMTGLFRQSVFGCLDGYEDENRRNHQPRRLRSGKISSKSSRLPSRTVLNIAGGGHECYHFARNLVHMGNVGLNSFFAAGDQWISRS
jgi:hypothetical protein